MPTSPPTRTRVWRGAILGGLVRSIKSFQSPIFAPLGQWIGQDYCVTDMQGQHGTVSFDNELLVATFFDQTSERGPYQHPGEDDPTAEYDLARFFHGMPDAHRSLLDRRPALMLEIYDDGIPCITTAFWNEGESLVAADPWDVVLAEGAELIRIEMIADLDEAMTEWQQETGMNAAQATVVRWLFDRKMAQPTGTIELSGEDVERIRSASPESIASGREACRVTLEALGFLLPEATPPGPDSA